MTDRELDRYFRNGFHVERALFSVSEVQDMIEHYMARRAEGPRPGDSAGVSARSPGPDPWKQYPRMIQMHEWDEKTRGWMNDPRLVRIASDLMRERALLIRTMVYFKPPGGRGQSFHQDSFYLRATPIVGAWLALDPADEENGAMQLMGGSHLLGLLPVESADTDISVTDTQTVMPPYLQLESAEMNPGDAVFFHSLTIHGSLPNRSPDRFRRAFICHYRGEVSFPLGPPATIPPSNQ